MLWGGIGYWDWVMYHVGSYNRMRMDGGMISSNIRVLRVHLEHWQRKQHVGTSRVGV